MKLKHLWAPLAGAIAITVAGATPALAVEPDPQTAILTGTPKLGEYMTITQHPDYLLQGTHFDIWMCPNKNVLPKDGEVNPVYGDCVAVTWWGRNDVDGFIEGNIEQDVATSMKWLIADEDVPGLNPSNDQPYLTTESNQIIVQRPDAAGGWCSYAGWYIIVNDFTEWGIGSPKGYSHSNWSEPFSAEGCPEGSGGGSGGSGSSGAGTLPDTGVSSTAGIVAGSLGLAAIAGGVLLVRARRLRANGN